MERKMLKKEVNGCFKNVVCVGYCDLWYLLKGLERSGYTCGIYGWNADIYIVNDNTAIVTGYRPFGNIDSNKKGLNKKYNEKARKICDNNKIVKWETKQNKINKLLDEYINKILEV